MGAGGRFPKARRARFFIVQYYYYYYQNKTKQNKNTLHWYQFVFEPCFAQIRLQGARDHPPLGFAHNTYKANSPLSLGQAIPREVP